MAVQIGVVISYLWIYFCNLKGSVYIRLQMSAIWELLAMWEFCLMRRTKDIGDGVHTEESE